MFPNPFLYGIIFIKEYFVLQMHKFMEDEYRLHKYCKIVHNGCHAAYFFCQNITPLGRLRSYRYIVH